MKSTVWRDTEESYSDYLQRLAQAEGLEAGPGGLRRHGPEAVSNTEWLNPHDQEAEIARLNDRRTALAYKPEQVVDMEAGAIMARGLGHGSP